MVNPVEISSTTPAFMKVTECLYRRAPTGIYHGLVKRKGHQFRKSFKTTDRNLAERSLAEFRLKAGRPERRDTISKVTISDLADAWLASQRPRLNLHCGADGEWLRVERFEVRMRAYSPHAVAPEGFKPYPVTANWLGIPGARDEEAPATRGGMV